ncbi:MAG: hypothetical protein ACRCWS_00760 [Propionibacteriaceae bacterium]
MLIISMLVNAGSPVHPWMLVAAPVVVGSGLALMVLDRKQRKQAEASDEELAAEETVTETGVEDETEATPDED